MKIDKLTRGILLLAAFISINSCTEKVIAAESSTIAKNSEMFTDRDVEQRVDLDSATIIKVEDNREILIDYEGIFIIKGNVKNTTIIIDVEDSEKVQLVLDGITIVNSSKPAIYIKSGDKVFITTTDSINSMSVNNDFENSGETNLDAVIFSKSDLVFNGIGTLNITSSKGNGISSKDDLKITGGIFNIKAFKDGLEANDSIRIFDGKINIVSEKDAIHSENEDNLLLGYIYMQGGLLDITAKDDGIRGTSKIQIDGGSIKINNSQEGIEATHIIINGGNIDIYATDDGINATSKSPLDVLIEVYGGNITIKMASGDTDAFDSNGDLYIYGGIISVEGQSTFDADGTAKLIDGSVTINGIAVTELPENRNGRRKPQRN